MNLYKISVEEQNYLAQYDITKFERPSLATDMAIFSIMEEGEHENYRKLPKKALKLLLIKRATYPFKDLWALPGGFCRPDEDVYETAKRELYEETHVNAAYLQLAGTFGEIGRDPRGWIISNTFLSLVNGEECKPRGGTDAWEAKWFSIDLVIRDSRKNLQAESVEIVTEYELKLCHEETCEFLFAIVKEYKQFEHYHETVRYEILDSKGLAFDHAKIILHTLLFLRKSVGSDWKLAFDLMPDLFTLTQLQNAFELILDQKLLTANFRRKINDYVIETEQSIEGSGHRPAKLFKRNIEEFYR
ncbi:MAG: NUDIX hydrolase [Lachnospiraceae bacterium]|nr:NUDIX hydrolase [Lachnospiraceae bacterium]